MPSKKPERMGFRQLITYVQVGKKKEVEAVDKKRYEKVENWLNKYASEDIKFEVQEKVNIKLDKHEKSAMSELKKILERKEVNESKLHDEFSNICEKAGINNKDFFEVVYKIILNKKKGPRLNQLIIGIGKDKVIKLLNQVI